MKGRTGRRPTAIVLRPLRPGDLEPIFGWESDPTAVALAAFTRPDPDDRAAFDAHHQRVLHDPSTINLAIESDQVLVGTIASFTVDGERELTYGIDPARWGEGIASRATALFLRHEVRRPLHSRAAAHNHGSSRVLERNGFVRIGEELSWADVAGRKVLEHVYRLT